MSFICEISGESLITLPPNSKDSIVVTPSGHICRRSLLLTKLLENGGVDPFETNRPLSEDELITLQLPNNTSGSSSFVLAPPRNLNYTMTASIQQIQNEYDALILELYDTRKLLEETRKELSLALYQNDAAIRVVARITAERDAALQTLQQWNAHPPPQPPEEEEDLPPEPLAKKVKRTMDMPSSLNETTVLSTNAIPQADLQVMLTTWDALHQTRRARQKAALQNVVTVSQLQSYQRLPHAAGSALSSDESMHLLSNATEEPRSTSLATCSSGSTSDSKVDIVVHVGTHRRIIFVYKKESQSTDWTFSQAIALGSEGQGCSKVDVLQSMDKNGTIIAVATKDFADQVYMFSNDTLIGRCSLPTLDGTTDGSENYVVDVRLHPDRQHFIVTARGGIIYIGRYDGPSDSANSMALMTQLLDSEARVYSAGALHPDGLIYVTAVVSTGDILLWDFKSQSLAGTLALPNDLVFKDGTTMNCTVTSVEFSNNGYHVAVAHEAGILVVWDLRKQSILKILNDDADTSKLDRIVSVQFDPSGKYLAYSGSIGTDLIVAVTTVKEWGRTMTFQVPNTEVGNGLVWGETWIAVSAIQAAEPKTLDPSVVFFGLNNNDDEK